MTISPSAERTDRIEALGYVPGESRRIASWTQIRAACDRVAQLSRRVNSFEIGPDWSGLPIPIYAVSEPETIERLQDYQARHRQRGASKIVVLVTASIHATEIGGTQTAPLLLHKLATSDDEAIAVILRESIVLLAPSLNPGGLELVREWYERTAGTDQEGLNPPYPDHPVGHDINRDWVMLSQPETRALVTQVLNPWRPHIHIDLHQLQNNGPRCCLPPYVDPVDPNIPPAVVAIAGAMGASVSAALIARGHEGVASGVLFDAYEPSRGYVFYHGGVRFLVEVAAARLASPISIPSTSLAAWRGFDCAAASSFQPLPWRGGTWTLRDVVDLLEATTLETLSFAARNRAELIEALSSHDPAPREPHGGWLIPPNSHQADPSATCELVSLLIAGDIDVRRVDEACIVDNEEFPAGTCFVPSEQLNAPYARTLLERSDYPGDRFSAPGRVHVPYDVTGHTLPLLMGVQVATAAAAPCGRSSALETAPKPIGWIDSSAGTGVFAIPNTSHRTTWVVNEAMRRGAQCHRVVRQFGKRSSRAEPGAFLLDGIALRELAELIRDTGIIAKSVDKAAIETAVELLAPRVGVYHAWRSKITDAGWTDHVLRTHGFTTQAIRDGAIREGALQHLSAIILPSQPATELLHGNSALEAPDEFCGGIGRTGMTALRTYVQQGGTLIALDAACDAALAIIPAPVLNGIGGLSPEQVQTPGCIVRMELDTGHPIGWGLPSTIAAMVTNSPVFDFRANAGQPIEVVARYPSSDPLLSGWLRGPEYLTGRATIVDMPIGRGRLVLFGLRPQFRAQSHGLFRLLFNAIFRGSLRA